MRKVFALHVKILISKLRTSDSFKRNFAELYNLKAPTGDPTIPLAVSREKTLRNDIMGKSDMREIENEDTDFGESYSEQGGEEDVIRVTRSPQVEADDEIVLFQSSSSPLSSLDAIQVQDPVVRYRQV